MSTNAWNYSEVAKRIKKLRKEQHYSLMFACFKLSDYGFPTTASTLSKYENAQIRVPIELLIACSHLYNRSTDFLLLGKEC